MAIMREVEVVGAGPAGLVAAINLARAGYRVTVYEEKPEVGHRFHGDFHPQYSGLFLIMIGMLIQWPTIVTALMFPVLIFVYYRLSKREEAEMIKAFGDEYKQYTERVPMFIPKL